MSEQQQRPRGDRARATVFVKVTPEVAFDVFTREIDQWWRRGPRFRNSGRHAGTLAFEPGVGGRLFETFDVDGEARTVVVGAVTAWEPPARLQFDWRNSNFAPHERTEVEVRFVAAPGGTEVSVEHRGWSALRPDHPARHGMEPGPFVAMIGMFWGDLLTSLRERVAPK
jgi:uncharacterized protein YndB with AHSA1/START domain